MFLSRLLDLLSVFLSGEYLGEPRDFLGDFDLLFDLLLSDLELLELSAVPSSSLTLMYEVSP